MLLLALGIIAKIIIIQFVNGPELQQLAKDQNYVIKQVNAPRGNIFADNEQKTSLAISVPRYTVYMDLVTIKEKTFNQKISILSDSLSKIFNSKSTVQWEHDLRYQRKKRNQYYLIAKDLNNNQINRLKDFPIFQLGQYAGGFISIKNNKRVRPFDPLAKRTIGYVNEKNPDNPIYVGLEGAFNETLKGQDGKVLMEKIWGNNWRHVEGELSEEPIPGYDIYTSIDVNIQDVAESALLHQLQNQSAISGCVVLMEVNTGYIKAIANLNKDKDQETYSESYNNAIGLSSEPGSTFKLASLMVALDDGKIKISDSVEMPGTYTFYDNNVLHDSKWGGYGKNTIQYAFEKSSNVISEIIYDNYRDEPQQFIDGLKEIGLHKKLGLPISGEGSPYIKDANDPLFSGISLPWMAIGYEVQLTPLQILTFYNGVANNGVMVKPKFVKEIRKGNEVKEASYVEVINPKICNNNTLSSVKKMLKGVVDRGTAKNIKARGFEIAGKTGTSLIAKGSSGYGNKYQASFCGYFPADDPIYSCIVVIQGPTQNIFGSIVSGTVFKEIADKVYAMGIMKSKKIEEIDPYYPFSKDGNNDDLTQVLKSMDIPLKKEKDLGDWVSSHTNEEIVNIKERKIVHGVVPNVQGMGLNDALYLLESQGLHVKVKGSGVVKKQSITPGKKVDKGELIIIDLS